MRIAKAQGWLGLVGGLTALLLVASLAERTAAQDGGQAEAEGADGEGDAESEGEGEGEGEAEGEAEGAEGEASEGEGESQGDEGGEPVETGGPAGDALFAGPDLGPLRQEYTSIMDDLVQVRSRMAVLGRQLFRTKVRVKVHNRADEQSLSRISVKLDGAPVFRADALATEDQKQVFEGFAAPGPHRITIEAEQRSRENDDYRYELRDTYRFEVLRGKMTVILVVLDDDSDIGEDFPDDEEGEYDVRTRVRVATRSLEGG